jgi:hypothetical protein
MGKSATIENDTQRTTYPTNHSTASPMPRERAGPDEFAGAGAAIGDRVPGPGDVVVAPTGASGVLGERGGIIPGLRPGRGGCPCAGRSRAGRRAPGALLGRWAGWGERGLCGGLHGVG